MKKNTRTILVPQAAFVLITMIATALSIFLLQRCTKVESKVPDKVNPAFNNYISAVTTGIISSETSIRLMLYEQAGDSAVIGKQLAEPLFKFNPAIAGKTYWVDSRTVEFIPDKKLPSDQAYNAKFMLSKVAQVSDDLETFEFYFKTMKQNFDVKVLGLYSYGTQDYEKQKLSGEVLTADVADNGEVEKLLTAEQADKPLVVKWDHDPGRKKHQFTIDNVTRQEQRSTVTLSWDGKALGLKDKGWEDVEVPAMGDFELIRSRVNQSPDQYLVLQFSDPLQADQNLDGLISINNSTDLDFVIEGNEIRVYPSVRQGGTQTIKIEPGVKNSKGFKMTAGTTLSVTFEQLKPQVREVGSGVVLPSTDGLVYPFEAVNLRAVDVTIIKIYSESVGQFLQVNDLSGSRELQRVGRPVVKKTIRLDRSGVVNLGTWNRYYIDLSDLLKTEPGAIYQVKIGFRKQHSTYHCEGDTEDDGEEDELTELYDESWDENTEDDYSYWDYYDQYYYYGGYSWQDRDNPCHNSYYGDRRSIKRNILASDLGLIAKRGENGAMIFAVTDLKTTNPISGADLELYDFQLKLLGTATTDGDGFAEIDSKRKPFLLVAKHGDQKGYLKLEDGGSLSTSNFDVYGATVQKGIKGFLYGERGVWRPGDSLYLTFMLEDQEQVLPESHPVIFELSDPFGEVKHRMVKTSSTNGFYSFHTATGQDDPTGNWVAKVQVGGATFSKVVKIETVKPNRLKIKLDFGTDKIYAGKGNVKGDLTVRWLHGAIAKNLKAKFEVFLTQTRTTFDKYRDYVFDDPGRKFSGESEVIFEDRIDKNGHAVVNADLKVPNVSPGMLSARFKGTVFEESGDFSVDRFSIPYSPYNSYVGIKMPKGDRARGMLLTDTTHTVEVVTVDEDGNPVSRDDLEFELYEIKWRWWWDRSGDDLASYLGSSYTRKEMSGTTSTTDGKGTLEFRVDYPEWGRYYLRVCDNASGHCTGQIFYIDWPGWAGRAQKENPGGAAILVFSKDKDKYEVGDKATLNIPTSENGRALISIENGSKVLQKAWITTKAGQTDYSFTVTDEMAPNVYAHVMLLQPHAQTANDLPIRLYGVTPVMVDDPETHIQPVITMAEELRPEKEVAIKVSEATGKPMTYTVAVVDEGLLDLTRFKTPDPWNHFYAKEALGVKTWDIYSSVIGAYGGKLERLLAIGGDGSVAADPSQAKVNRFKPVVKFLGPFHLEPGETKEHKYIMPQYVGSVRTMVVAGYEGAYGSAEQATPVREPLMVLGTLPRVLGPEEIVKLPVTVFAMKEEVKDVEIKVETNDILEVTGGNTRSLRFDQPGDDLAYFDVKVKPRLGVGKVKIIATSGDHQAEYEVELAVRNPNPAVTDVISTIIEAGQTWTTDYKPVGMAGTNSGIIEVSNIPPINLGKRLKYLILYPHGCIEQTTSSVFPQLFVDKVMELDGQTVAEIERNIKAGIDRLQSFQVSDGGFGYWQNAMVANEWGSNYAGHFLLEAKSMGYSVPSKMLRRWKKFQKRIAQKWTKVDDKYYNGPHNHHYHDDLMQAYRLYTLALAGDPELGAMNRMREMDNLSVQAQWRLAAAYVLAGQPEVAAGLVRSVTMHIPEYKELSYTYGSQWRDKAMILETLGLMDNRERGVELIEDISEQLNQNDYWMSTQTTAYCLLAVMKFVGAGNQESNVKFTYQIDNSDPVAAETKLPLAQVEMVGMGMDGGNVKIENKSAGMLYAKVILEGKPVIGDSTSANNDLTMKVKYLTMNGDPIDPRNIEQGTDFVAEVTLKNPGLRGDYKEMALTQIFPSGWEIHNTRLDGTEQFHNISVPTYQDIRDDRVYTYFDINANQTQTYTVLLNASYVGKYYLPSVYCEAMYDNEINARKGGTWVQVVKPVAQ